MIIISACLVGVNCRYNGLSVENKELLHLINSGKAIAICPEVLGNLPIPRDPCEIQTINGELKVISKSGRDCTAEFRDGAERTLNICNAANAKYAILKANSPSCGFGKIYDGTFTSTIIDGNGITANLLSSNGIAVFNENNYSEFLSAIKA